MLTELSVTNFKLLDDTGVTLRTERITVLIGANGTGKSSLLQALLILKQSFLPPYYNGPQFRLDGPLLPAGTFETVVHRQDVKRAITVALNVNFEQPALSQDAEDGLERATFAYKMTATKSQGEQEVIVKLNDGRKLTTVRDPELGRQAAKPSTLRVTNADFGLDASNLIGKPIRISSYASNAERERVRLDAVLDAVGDFLAHYYLIPAIRGFDQLNYPAWEGDQPEDLTAAGSAERQAALVANALGAHPEVADQVSTWLNAILQHPNRHLRPKMERGRISGEMVSGRRGTNVFHEAFGMNQLVAPLLWLSMAPPGAMIAIEEPEIHLHPRAQASLCDVIVEAAIQQQKQLVLTTHSEHILMGLLTAVAQGRLDPSDLAVYEFRRHDDTARAERLTVNSFGQIAGGLGEFLEVDKEEIGELIKARLG